MIEVQGADLSRLAKQLREAGAKDLQRELYRGMERAMKPMKAAVKQSALDTLPKRGGLAARVAKSSVRTVRRTGLRMAGVRLSAKNEYVIGRLNRGKVRHPVYGNGVWVDQSITPGWWSVPAHRTAPQARKEILQALDEVARKAVRGI